MTFSIQKNTIERPPHWSPPLWSPPSTQIFLHFITTFDPNYRIKHVTLTLNQDHTAASATVYEEEQIIRPIKVFIADFVRKQLIGLPGQVLGHVLCMLIEGLGVSVTAEVALRDVGANSKVSVEALCQKVRKMENSPWS